MLKKQSGEISGVSRSHQKTFLFSLSLSSLFFIQYFTKECMYFIEMYLTVLLDVNKYDGVGTMG